MTSNSPNSAIQAKKEPEMPFIKLMDVSKLTGIPYKTLWRKQSKIPGYMKDEWGTTYFDKKVLVEHLTKKPKRLG